MVKEYMMSSSTSTAEPYTGIEATKGIRSLPKSMTTYYFKASDKQIPHFSPELRPPQK